MYLANDWTEYQVLDAGDGEKLERWGDYKLVRPDPQSIWRFGDREACRYADAHYHRSESGGGAWEYRNKLPEFWVIHWRALSFLIKPMGFKHTGLFPEQAANWAWMTELISKADQPVNVLNLFAYTGGATVACAAAGAAVCHVDAAKGMIAQAKTNMQLSGLTDKPVRFIIDDCAKFVAREARRGKKYDAVIMDPPSYGRGPNGEVWKIEDELVGLVESAAGLLTDKPLFFLINSYTTGLQPAVLKNILINAIVKRYGGKAESDEVGLPIRNGLVLPCGASGRWRASGA